MLTERDMQGLLAFQSEQPVLSVYLNTDPSLGNADAYKLRLRTMLKEVNLRADVEAIERYIELEYDWSGRSLVMFSCAEQGFFKAFRLAVPVQDRLRIDSQPHVKPLVNLLDAYGGYGVAVVDKQGARLFSFHLGELREQNGVLGEEVRHVKRGGASTVTGQRGGTAGRTGYMDEVAERNMKESADFAAQFFSENHVRRVLLAGTDDNLAQFRAHLPKTWQSLILGTFAAPMTASHGEIYARALEIAEKQDHQREKLLVEKAITAAAKGHDGVIGLDDTLEAARHGRVLTLLIEEGYRTPGKQCQGCGYLTTQALEACPFCGDAFAAVPDAVELAVREVLKAGGEVEVVRANPELEKAGMVAGVLRY